MAGTRRKRLPQPSATRKQTYIETDISHSPAGAYRCANRKSLSEKRDKLLKRKHIPQRELANTLVALNETQPINTLPRELLIYIIELLFSSLDGLSANNWPNQLYVCRRWYEIIIPMPSFWRRIYVSASPEWLELCLSRSAGMTVDIHFTGRFSLQATVSTLKERGQVVRAITYSVLRSSWASDISKLLAVPLPALERVDMLLKTKSERLAVVDLPPESYARLQSLCLQYCSAPLDCATYASLRKLKLTHSKWSISLTQLINLLHADQLQELVLDDCLSHIRDCPDGFPETGPLRRPPVKLSRLQTLQLTSVRSSISAHILAHIRVPNATQIAVHTFADGDYPQPGVWALLPEDPTLFSPIFSTATSLAVGVPHSYYCNFNAQSAAHVVSMQVQLRGHGQFSNSLHTFDKILDMFPRAPLSTLAVSGAQHVSEATWKRVFRSLATLQHLELTGQSYVSHVFAGLRSASEHGGPVMSCPVLATIRMKDYSYGHHFDPTMKATVDRVLAALRVRAERGIKLEELKIEYPHLPWASEQMHLRTRFLTALRNLVPQFTFNA